MKKLLIDSQFLPPIEFFSALTDHDEILLEAHEYFVKQTYRNRCYILGAKGPLRLIIPVKHGKGEKIPMKSVKIDYSTNWIKDHWRTIESCYNKSPFFEHYKDAFKDIYDKKHENLWDINREMLSLCLTLLGFEKIISSTKNFIQEGDNDLFSDQRGKILPKKSFNYRKIYTPVTYFQMFGKTFVENLSIIDLLFCLGPESSRVVTESKRQV